MLAANGHFNKHTGAWSKWVKGGKLSHRIKYKGGDEFDAVCSNFNEMASRLSDMVELKTDRREKPQRIDIRNISYFFQEPINNSAQIR